MSAIQTFATYFDSYELRYFVTGDETASDAEMLMAIANAPPLFEAAIANWQPFKPIGDLVAAHYNPGLGMTFASKSRDSIVLPLGVLSDDLATIGKFNLLSGTKYLNNGGTHVLEIISEAARLTLRFTRARSGFVTRYIFTRLPGGQLTHIATHKSSESTGYNYEVKYVNGFNRFSSETKAGKKSVRYYDATGKLTRKDVNGAIVKARVGSYIEDLRTSKLDKLSSPTADMIVRERAAKGYKSTPKITTTYMFIYPDHIWTATE